MAPHKASNGRGSLLFDRRFPGVGRIRTATGTKDPALMRKLDRMLTNLFEANPPRLDVLRAIQEGRLRPLEVYEMQLAGDLSTIPGGNGLEVLRDVWTAWVEDTPHPKTKTARRLALPVLEGYCASTLPLVAHLPKAVRQYRAACARAETPAAFNRVRATVLAFIRDYIGLTDVLHVEVSGIQRLEEVKHKRPAPTLATVLQVRELLEPEVGAMWWSMVRTGMGLEEYWGRWEAGPVTVAIHGTKRRSRDRIIPRVGQITPPAMHRKTFELRLKAFTTTNAQGLDVEPYDARRAFAHVLELAGIPMTRRKQYMGHSVKGDVTEGYTATALAPFIPEDAAAMARVIEVAEHAHREARRGHLKVG